MAVGEWHQRATGKPSVVVWGTYDVGKPRVRILLQAARDSGISMREIHADVWRGVDDKSQIRGIRQRTAYLLRWMAAYPPLLCRYLFSARHDLVFVPYMGHLDVILLRPLARLRRVPVVWDALLSLHGTLVEDRGLVATGSVTARALRLLDRLAFACADQLITGTAARARQFRDQYSLGSKRITPIFVATEQRYFQPATENAVTPETDSGRPRILFYGQFSPLHGLPTVLQAAASEVGRQWDWLIVGTGQEGWRIGPWMKREAARHVQWRDWIPYPELAAAIGHADVCLGTFGASQKASTGISNKIFQILACGRPLITADTPAIRELLTPDMPGVFLVPAEDPDALIETLSRLRQFAVELRRGTFHQQLMDKMDPVTLARQFYNVLAEATATYPTQKVSL